LLESGIFPSRLFGGWSHVLPAPAGAYVAPSTRSLDIRNADNPRCGLRLANEPTSHRIEMSYRDFKGIMRPGQNKRRGRNPNNPNNPNNNPNRQRMPNRMQTFDSNGPSVKIRGNAYQVFERYVALAREAATSGDRIAAENLYQHAEHYFRIMNANGEGQGQQGGVPRPMTPADTEMTGSDAESGEHDSGSQQAGGQGYSVAQPGYSGGPQGSSAGQQGNVQTQPQEPAPSSPTKAPAPQTDPFAN
jgi:Domain of unknown function (DUF4167)